MVFLLSNISWVKGMTELDKPVSGLVGVNAFGTHSAGIATPGQQQLRSCVFFFGQHLKGKRLHLVE